jgi:hypothetical protein
MSYFAIARDHLARNLRATKFVLLFFIALFLAGADCAVAQVSGPGLSGKRVALVVGNSKYQHVARLDNPGNDARLIAATLKDLGFTLVGGAPQLDLDKVAFDRAVQTFGREVSGADVALFYYAGHGLQVRGVNWLVPTTANPVREADINFELVNAGLVLRQLEGAKTRLNLMILDACRNNPFGTRGFRAATGGLAQMQAPEGMLIVYATQPGNLAMDGADGNSPFTKVLATTIKKPGLDVFSTFNEVGLQVKRLTGGVQQPWVSSSPVDGEFYFAGLPPAASATASPEPFVAQPDAETLFWQSISASSNPELYKAYLQQFPNGRFAGMAAERVREAVATTQQHASVSSIPVDPKTIRPFDRDALVKDVQRFKIPVPDIVLDYTRTPVNASDWVGVWGPERWRGYPFHGPGGAAYVAISHVNSDGNARVLYAWGQYNPVQDYRYPRYQEAESGYRFVDAVIRDGEVTFVTHSGNRFTFSMTPDGDLTGRMLGPAAMWGEIVLRRRR